MQQVTITYVHCGGWDRLIVGLRCIILIPFSYYHLFNVLDLVCGSPMIFKPFQFPIRIHDCVNSTKTSIMGKAGPKVESHR